MNTPPSRISNFFVNFAKDSLCGLCNHDPVKLLNLRVLYVRFQFVFFFN